MGWAFLCLPSVSYRTTGLILISAQCFSIVFVPVWEWILSFEDRQSGQNIFVSAAEPCARGIIPRLHLNPMQGIPPGRGWNEMSFNPNSTHSTILCFVIFLFTTQTCRWDTQETTFGLLLYSICSITILQGNHKWLGETLTSTEGKMF